MDMVIAARHGVTDRKGRALDSEQQAIVHDILCGKEGGVRSQGLLEQRKVCHTQSEVIRAI